MKKLVLSLLAAACAALPARAAITVTAPTATTAGLLTITTPISFTITTAGNLGAFVLDEWVTSDGSPTFSSLGSNLAFTLNGTASSSAATLADNYTANGTALTPNDGLIRLATNTSALAVGNTVTLSAGTYTLGAVSGFNPQATQTFNGNLFLTGASAERLSANVSANVVPEPSTWAFVAAGTAGLGVVLRRRHALRLA